MKNSGFACMECGHRFRTAKAAERASFGPNGCPKCGSSDIDFNPYDKDIMVNYSNKTNTATLAGKE